MTQCITIGDTSTFAVEIYSVDPTCGFAEVFFVVAGKHVSGGNPVYVPTFVGELAAFLEMHDSTPRVRALPEMSHERAFAVLHDIAENDICFAGITSNDVWHYNRFYNIDTAVDGWEIYVYDAYKKKHIVCRDTEVYNNMQPGDLVSTVVSRDVFVYIISTALTTIITQMAQGVANIANETGGGGVS